MSAPVITALATYIPDPVPLSRWYEIESALRRVDHPGWNAWIRSWQQDYATCSAAPGESNDDRSVYGDCSPPGSTMISVEADTDLCGLAAKVAIEICAARAPDAHPVDIVMFCHSSPEESVPVTIAGRLRAVVGTPCFPFSISQQQGVSLFTALRLAADFFMAESGIHTILIVAAEKWCPPFSRWAGTCMLQGDAAGALLLERHGEDVHGLSLINARTRMTRPLAIAQLRCPSAIHGVLAPALFTLIGEMLEQQHLCPDDIGAIVGHHGMPALVWPSCALAGLTDPCYGPGHQVHLGAAESIVRLAQMLHDTTLSQRVRILLWGFGLGGYVGCALLEAHDAARLFLNRNAS